MTKSKKKKILFFIAVFMFVSGSIVIFGNESSDEKNKKDNEPQIIEREAEKNDSLVKRVEGLSAPELQVEAAYSVYYEEGEEEILFSQNRHEKLPIASITKLMTALIIYENYNLNEPIRISESHYLTDSHLSDLRIFSDTTYGDLLYPLLLESNNSSAYAAAIAPRDIEFDEFIFKMNQRADELGMKRTFFHNPSGLDNFRGVNHSTARDLSLLIEKLLDYPLFWDILQKESYEIRSRSSDLYYLVETTNKFLDGTYFLINHRPEWHENIIGGKTGFTYQAMGCLVVVLETEKGYLINVILGADGRIERFEEMEKLINWVYKSYNL